MKKIPEQKLQAFSIGAMGMRSLSKKELEEQRKKEEDEATAHVFQEFVELFQEAPSKTSKVWVKAGTYDAGARKEDNSERGKLYKPQSRLSDANEKKASAEQVEEFTRSFASKPDKPTKKRGDKDKKKSNLELFKEELRQIQEEREERHKYKGVLKTVLADTGDIPAYAKDEPTMGSYDNGDPTTTNLYLGNLNPKVTEQQLMEIFGRYGPLASIKIMWPRSDEEKARGRNCGFVAFMARKDAERALRCINGKDIMGYEMKMGWGKALLIPACPIYIPPALQQPSQPPPQSGLPFNAQPPKHLANKIPRVRPGESYPSDPEDQKLYEQILSQSIVRVVIPTERNVLMMIHRMVEFVIREGPMFEAMIMNKEINNPFFRFLFENQSPAHVYYRWKLFSLLQGDSPKTWSLKDFRMFKAGSVWRPPILNMYTQGMPEDLVEEDEIVKDNRGTLSKTQRERLEELIRLLTPERSRVAEAMVFCMEHAEAAEEIADCLAESLSMLATAIHKKVARIYLISDILHNCGIKLTNASYFRKALERRLVQIMVDARAAWLSLEARLQREGFRARVLRVLGAWDHWVVYPKDFLRLLNDTFMGVENKPLEDNPEAVESGGEVGGTEEDEAVSDAGSEEGGPLDGAALRRLAAAVPVGSPARAVPVTSAIAAAAVPVVDDIDGVPLDEDIDGVPLDTSGTDPGSFTVPWDGAGSAPGFVPSRWESVEPAQLQAQAVTTSQWELLAPERRESEPPSPPSPPTPAHSGHDSSQDWESRRALLRAVEVRALRYQDELESGRRALRAGLTMQQQVQHYRRKLIKKAEREVKEKEEVEDSPESRVSDSKRVHRERGTRSISSEEGYTTSTSRKSKKSKEISLSPPPPPKRSRHRSRSAERERDRGRDRRRARSPSPAPSPPRHHTSSSRRHKHKHKY